MPRTNPIRRIATAVAPETSMMMKSLVNEKVSSVSSSPVSTFFRLKISNTPDKTIQMIK